MSSDQAAKEVRQRLGGQGGREGCLSCLETGAPEELLEEMTSKMGLKENQEVTKKRGWELHWASSHPPQQTPLMPYWLGEKFILAHSLTSSSLGLMVSIAFGTEVTHQSWAHDRAELLTL